MNNTKFFVRVLIMFFLINGIFLQIPRKTAAEISPSKKVLHLISQEEYQSAFEELENLKSKKSQWGYRNNYLMGFTALRLKKSDSCISNFEKVVREYKILADYADYNLSRCYSGSGDFQKATSHLKNFEKRYPYSRLFERVLFERGKQNVNAGNYKKGVKFLKAFTKRYSKSENSAEAYFLLGQTLEKLKKPTEAYEPYRILHYKYPLTPFAKPALKRTIVIRRDRTLMIKNTPVSLRLVRAKILRKRGYFKKAKTDLTKILKVTKNGNKINEALMSLAFCYLRLKQKNKAIETLEKHIKSFPNGKNSPKALYDLGSIYWNLGKTDKAMLYMRKTIKRFPLSKKADRATFVVARIHESQGKFDNSLATYDTLMSGSKDKKLAQKAFWRAGWINYKRGNYKEMLKIFGNAIKKYPGSDMKNSYLYWSGRGFEKEGNMNDAISIYSSIRAFPFAYYSSFSDIRLTEIKEQSSFPKNDKSASKISFSPDAKNELAAPNYKKTLDRIIKNARKKDKAHITKALELIKLNFKEDAKHELGMATSIFYKDSDSKFVLGILYNKVGYYNKSISVHNDILLSHSVDRVEILPYEFKNSLYPLTYMEYVERYSKKYKIDPLLVFSIIRQESKFNPKALSFANARGLMQLIPTTGKKLYRKLHKDKFDPEILFDPEINIELGIRYLSEVLSRFKNNLVHAIASYNAGPDPVKRWARKYKNKPVDEFIESITYPQTRGYVKKVLSNYENYKRLYQNLVNREARKEAMVRIVTQ